MPQEPPSFTPPTHTPPFKDTTTFGARGSMRTENNIGGDGGERPSVKLHAAPGGQQHFNIFGGYEPPVAAPVHKVSPPSYSAPPPSYSAPAPAYEPAPFGDHNRQAPPSFVPPTQTYTDHGYGAPPPRFDAPMGGAMAPPPAPAPAAQPTGEMTFGQRVKSGWNSGPTTEVSSVRVHAPPGGKSQIFF